MINVSGGILAPCWVDGHGRDPSARGEPFLLLSGDFPVVLGLCVCLPLSVGARNPTLILSSLGPVPVR